MKQGIYDISEAEYHADPCDEPSLSSSVAKVLIEQSPLHAWTIHPRFNPSPPSNESGPMDYGKAVHSVLLENNTSGLVVVDASDWRTKAAKTQREEARSLGKVPILKHQFDKVETMVSKARDVLRTAEFTKDIWDKGRSEQSIVWKDGNIWCRSRLDRVVESANFIFDYKTTTNADPFYLCRRMLSQMGYDVQEAFYRRGYTAIFGKRPTFVFLFQEVEPPFACSLISPGPSMQALGDEKVSYAVKLWEKCTKSGHWPSYTTQVHFADADAWQMAAFAERTQ